MIALTKAQERCLKKLRNCTLDNGWIWNYRENIGYSKRTLNTLVELKLVEYDRGCYRAITAQDSNA